MQPTKPGPSSDDDFEQHGIAAHRLDLRPYTAEAQMMQEYADVDIALDPFPYNGCTTTCDALAMGVPVVTLAGSTLPGRHGVALLTAAGFPGNVARSRDEYVELAVRLAGSIATMPTRAEVRDRFLASPVCDAPRFARAFEQLFRDDVGGVVRRERLTDAGANQALLRPSLAASAPRRACDGACAGANARTRSYSARASCARPRRSSANA